MLKEILESLKKEPKVGDKIFTKNNTEFFGFIRSIKKNGDTYNICISKDVNKKLCAETDLKHWVWVESEKLWDVPSWTFVK